MIKKVCIKTILKLGTYYWSCLSFICLQILSMIEEAAGTKLYESKKETAQKTIEKKDAKLNEIDTVC